jgi:predicted acylesterase/phospholipase RssA
LGKLALVLSGGGARGAFQAGALVELLAHFERTGKRVNILSGTSVGALNGMSIAQAESLAAAREEIESQWKNLTNDDVYKIRGWGIVKLIAKLATRRIETTHRSTTSMSKIISTLKRFVRDEPWTNSLFR